VRRTVFASLCALALLLFFGALAFPAVGTCPQSGADVPNWFGNDTILFFGWMAVLTGQWGWMANIPFAINVVLLMLGRRPGFWSPGIQAFFLAVAVMTLLPSRGMRLPHNEAWDEPVCWLGTGFWLWVAAQALVCAAAVVASLIQPRPPRAPRPPRRAWPELPPRDPPPPSRPT
jgi:hypothetical protein